MDKLPQRPKGLPDNAAALWAKYAAELHGRNMLEKADLSALERLCRLEASADELTAKITDEGALYKDRDGDERRHPALLALNTISGIVDSLKRSLSIGAYYRHRIKGSGKEQESETPGIMHMVRGVYKGNAK
jgi:P27 family predicted phage terminase small subunit